MTSDQPSQATIPNTEAQLFSTEIVVMNLCFLPHSRQIMQAPKNIIR